MSDTVFLAKLSWPEFQERASRRGRIRPFVATEQKHGRHMPLGVDAILADRC